MATAHTHATDGGQAAAETLRARLVAPLPVTDERVELAGIPTAVLTGGAGPPVVLLHGPGELAATWLRVLPELVGSYRVVAPDLPGHGASGLGDGKLDADRVSAWLAGLIERFCSGPPALVGHLLGGALAARYAADRRDGLNHLVLVDTYGLARLRPSPAFAVAMLGFVARPNERTQRRLMGRCMAAYDTLRADMGGELELLEAYALDRARGPDLRAALRALMPRFGLPAIPAAHLAAITAPTTLIWGRHDLQVRLQVAEAASARFGWPLHVIEDAADDPAVEQPRDFLAALHRSLARTTPQGDTA